jgi:hypothetical protein
MNEQMRPPIRAIAVSLFVVVAGCSTTTQPSSDDEQRSANDYCVPIAQYSNHIAGMKFEYLHRLQINDINGLRTILETWLAFDVRSLWESTQNERTSKKDRDLAYGLLRLMAIQNEKFPVDKWNSDPEITAIFQAAIENDRAHAELLRRQNWNNPGRVDHPNRVPNSSNSNQ